ncbi:ATPase [Granulicella sp. dw_53]|uniref:ATP-grasp domain-containing protein n=1 Tax=Granulicella sp. dw_53 TaxID=2719792 RepID=UPI001BD58E09
MTDSSAKPTILCISTYEKGQAFLREAALLGCRVILLTVADLLEASWPRESLARLITMPKGLLPQQVLNTVSYLAREEQFAAIVALDEFDLEVAALLREHMRLPGMGESKTRFFRDKLAMRVRARDAGVAVPEFTPVFAYSALRRFMEEVPGPWLLKPRMNAAAIGIRRIESAEQLFGVLGELGDLQSHYVLERFVPGEIFHVEGITWKGRLQFSAPFQYGAPPMQTMHEGGVFSTRALARDSSDAMELREIHARVIAALGLESGVTHTEFIKSRADGRFYFLETAARVGGAYIAEVVEFATGVNPWVEWARLEAAALFGREYKAPEVREAYAGSVICLARQERPDTIAYDDAEIVMRLEKYHHAGLIVRSKDAGRVEALVREYSGRFLEEFCAVEPVPDRPTA